MDGETHNRGLRYAVANYAQMLENEVSQAMSTGSVGSTRQALRDALDDARVAERRRQTP